MVKKQVKVTAVLFEGPGMRRPEERSLATEDFIVGRSEIQSPKSGPELDMCHDLRVSRAHARVRKREGVWCIEDLASKRGTFVDGENIQGRGPVRLIPGAPVRTGNTLWTIIPQEWLFVYRGTVTVSGPCAEAVNYACYHCGTPVVGDLTARNVGPNRSGSCRLTLLIEGHSERCEVDVPQLDPGSGVSLGTPPIRLNRAQLELRTHTATARLRVELEGRVDSKATREMTVLPFWSWSHGSGARRTLAAFVSPDNPIVRRINSHAWARTTACAGMVSFKDLVRSGRDDAERFVLEALYQYLCDECVIRWHPPEASGHYQRIKPAHHIFATTKPPFRGEATCIDLALLMASCLECADLWPIIVLTGKHVDVPSHALVGCWGGPAPGSRGVICDRQYLQRQIEKGHLLLAECTGVARGAAKGQDTLGVSHAYESAAHQLREEPWVCAVDIGALRPPYGSITSVECPFEPEVRRAYAEAERFAERKARAIETTCLFYGCLAADGPVIRWLFDGAGLDRTALCDSIDRVVEDGSCTTRPSITPTCSACRDLALDISEQAGSPSVREQDLLWSIFLEGCNSTGLCEVCTGLGIELNRLSQLLGERHPPPDLPQSLRLNHPR